MYDFFYQNNEFLISFNFGSAKLQGWNILTPDRQTWLWLRGNKNAFNLYDDDYFCMVVTSPMNKKLLVGK